MEIYRVTSEGEVEISERQGLIAIDNFLDFSKDEASSFGWLVASSYAPCTRLEKE